MAGWIRLFAGAILVCVGLASCAASALPVLPAGSVRAQYRSDDVTFTLDSPRDPQINHAQHLRVTLLDAQGRPIEAESLYLDMTMDMLCLSGSKPVAQPTAQGRYEVDVVYVMAGSWRVTAVAELADRELRATFPITVSE
ncbi:MAG: hypothetical protein HGA65_08985 [Oscillochloris sp.]|nr:hypothetical protein [Oscillochloris sp.]